MKPVKIAKSRAALKVPFAYTEGGVLIEPGVAEGGAAFRCPGCNGEVRRRRSSRGRLHFYHRDPRDERESCGETALHLAAKAVLGKIESLRLPELRLPVPTPSGGPVRVYPGGVFDVDKAELEVSLENGERVVDVVLTGSASPPLASPKIYIEVCVTNPIIGERKAWFRKWQVPALEISVCHIEDPALGAVQEALNQAANQRWIHHPDHKAALADAREKLRLADEEHKKKIAAQRAREEIKRRQKQEALDRRNRLQAKAYDNFRTKYLPEEDSAGREARWKRQLREIKREDFAIALAIVSTHPFSKQPESRQIIKERAAAGSPAVWLTPCIKVLAHAAPYSVADPSTVCDLARRARISDADAFHLLSLEIDVETVTTQLASQGRQIAKAAADRERATREHQKDVVNERYDRAKAAAAAINAQNRLTENARQKSGHVVTSIERWIPCPTCFDKKSVRWSTDDTQPGQVTCNCTNILRVPADIVEKDI